MKFGIIGTGRIAHRFMSEIRAMQQDGNPGIEVCGVCNPHADSAARFSEEENIKYYTTDADELAGRVDASYIASPHETHYAYARQMLERGCHVLCEKPMTMSRAQARELFALTAKKGLVLMEAVKTAYCPGFAEMLGVVSSGQIGEVRDVEACFTKLVAEGGRELADGPYAGSFTELGSYALLPIAKILVTNPRGVDFHSYRNEGGIDLYTKAYFDYGEAAALAKVGLGVKSEGQLVISGTKGYIVVKSPWWLTKEFVVRYEDSSVQETYTAPFEGGGLRYEVGAFADKVAGAAGDTCMDADMALECRNEHISNVADGMSEQDFEPSGDDWIYTSGGLSPEESIWMAGVMEKFLEHEGRISAKR